LPLTDLALSTTRTGRFPTVTGELNVIILLRNLQGESRRFDAKNPASRQPSRQRSERFKGVDSMPHEIVNSMRALREDMRQRLLQVPEYRALVALDRSIDEISMILQESFAVAAQQPVAQEIQAITPQAAHQEAAPPVAARQNAIASAFAETLAAKIDQRNGARASGAILSAHRAHVG
jgi:hypothetical protein